MLKGCSIAAAEVVAIEPGMIASLHRDLMSGRQCIIQALSQDAMEMGVVLGKFVLGVEKLDCQYSKPTVAFPPGGCVPPAVEIHSGSRLGEWKIEL